MCHKTELVADFLDEPVPTTSPTKTTGFPFCFNSSIVFKGSLIPSLGIFNIDSAWRGISGLDQASGAGERSSVFISPGTLKTVSFMVSDISSLLVNHSAFAHELITVLAYSFVFDIS